jgi:hypothetical protein
MTLHPVKNLDQQDAVAPRSSEADYTPNKFDNAAGTPLPIGNWAIFDWLSSVPFLTKVGDIAARRHQGFKIQSILMITTGVLIASYLTWYLMYQQQNAGQDGDGMDTGIAGDEVSEVGGTMLKWSCGGMTLSAEAGYANVSPAERTVLHGGNFLWAGGLLSLQAWVQQYNYDTIKESYGKDAADKFADGKVTAMQLFADKHTKKTGSGLQDVAGEFFGQIKREGFTGLNDVLGNLGGMFNMDLGGIFGKVNPSAAKTGTKKKDMEASIVVTMAQKLLGNPSIITGLLLASSIWLLLPYRLIFTTRIGERSWVLNGLPHMYTASQRLSYLASLYYTAIAVRTIVGSDNKTQAVWKLLTTDTL